MCSLLPRTALAGRVVAAGQNSVSVEGLALWLCVGTRLSIEPSGRAPLTAEVVGIRDGRAEAVAFQPLDGVPAGCPAVLRSSEAGLAVGDGWLGRVVDPLGRPLDGGGPLAPGPRLRPVRAAAPDA